MSFYELRLAGGLVLTKVALWIFQLWLILNATYPRRGLAVFSWAILAVRFLFRQRAALTSKACASPNSCA